MFKYRQLVSQRQARCQRWLSSSGHVNNNHSSTVAPSQLLRYALNGEPKNATARTTRTKLDKELELVLSQQRFNTTEKRQKQKDGRLISLPGAQPPPPTDLPKVANLHELQLWLEQHASAGFEPSLKANELNHALLNCEKSHSSLEILSVLSAIITRRRYARVEIDPVLRITGLFYASQSFSPRAFSFYLNGLQAPLKMEDSKRVILCLLQTLRTIRLADPAYDTRPMLELVAGENDQGTTASDTKCLIDMVELDDELHSPLIELLLELGVTKSHERVWGYLIYRMDLIKQTVDIFPSRIIDDAYKCILVFLKTGMTDYATSCMKQISEKVGKSPPSLHLSSDLAANLNEHGLDVPTFIEEQISPADGQSQGYDISSTDNLRMDGDMVDFSIVESLLTQIEQHGTSASASQISIVIDALNDCEGATIPLFIHSVEDRTFEFAWAPRWVPVVSPLESISFTRTLGLLRAQMASRKILISSERCRNLIQLGHLVQREISSTDPRDLTSSWEKTGYLVVFDRVSAEYLVLYMGQSFKLIDSEYQPPPPPHPEGEEKKEGPSNAFEQHPVLGSLSGLSMPRNAMDLTRDIADVVLPVGNAADRYFIDLDPGNGLQP